MRKKRKKIGLIFILLVYILVSPSRERKYLPDYTSMDY